MPARLTARRAAAKFSLVTHGFVNLPGKAIDSIEMARFKAVHSGERAFDCGLEPFDRFRAARNSRRFHLVLTLNLRWIAGIFLERHRISRCSRRPE